MTNKFFFQNPLSLVVGSRSARSWLVNGSFTACKFLATLLLLLTIGVGQMWGAVYFEDTFSNVGNSDNQSISSRTGWSSFTKCYSQGNSGLRIGSGNAGGSVTKTAMSGITGTKNLKVTVYVARYNTNANTLTITCTNGTISGNSVSISPSNNAGVTSTTSTATWSDTYKTEFTITGASSSTTITFASNKRVILGPVKIEDAVAATPSLTLSPTSWDFGSVGTGDAASKKFSVSGSNLTAGTLTISVPSGYSVSPSSINVSAGALSATDVTVSKNTSTASTYNGNLSVYGGGVAQANAVTASLSMTVVAPIAVTGVSLNKASTSLEIGHTETLTATVSPNNATNKNVTWESSNTNIATVNNGVVTAAAVGSATITCKSASDATKTATCTVTVTPHVVTPGKYDIVLANAFWGTNGTGTNAGHTASGSQNDISVSITGSSGTQNYINDSETRIYGSHSITFSVPSGFVLKEITGLGTESKSDIAVASGSTGTITTRVWSGSAQSVTFAVSSRTDFSTVSVTYEATCTELGSINGSFFVSNQ